jgi:hypothetical protein
MMATCSSIGSNADFAPKVPWPRRLATFRTNSMLWSASSSTHGWGMYCAMPDFLSWSLKYRRLALGSRNRYAHGKREELPHNPRQHRHRKDAPKDHDLQQSADHVYALATMSRGMIGGALGTLIAVHGAPQSPFSRAPSPQTR